MPESTADVAVNRWGEPECPEPEEYHQTVIDRMRQQEAELDEMRTRIETALAIRHDYIGNGGDADAVVRAMTEALTITADSRS
ncbi:hypothetical protein [Saccharopolyspora hattusasensis]|uniref:hypothetical protein n=1 Tax=Saccharopolyspora hattusasensis TaxID=1128679 RepID=UPI003D991A09